MSEYPYTTVPGKLETLLKKIPDMGVPTSTGGAWLRGIGFTSSNDPSLLKVLKFIGIIDSSGTPTESWRSLRSRAESRKALAQCILEGYSALFDTYSDAHERTEQELTGFFSEQTNAGKQVVSKTVATFKNLCALADFDETNAERERGQVSSFGETTPGSAREAKLGSVARANIVPPEVGGNITINLNIQLSLPSEMGQAGYDAFFAALRKHLVEPYNETDE